MAVYWARKIKASVAFEARRTSEVFGSFVAFMGVSCSTKACRLLAKNLNFTISWAKALRLIVSLIMDQS